MEEILQQEITIPRKEGRPPYVTHIPAGAVTLVQREEGATNVSITLTDQQWAEYLEVPLDEFLMMKQEAMREGK